MISESEILLSSHFVPAMSQKETPADRKLGEITKLLVLEI